MEEESSSSSSEKSVEWLVGRGRAWAWARA
jgi:hypothetical protein